MDEAGERDEAGEQDKAAAQQGCSPGCVWVLVAIVGFAVVATVLSNMGGGDDGPDDTGAVDVCHQAVEDQLKAPGTADYGGETVTHTGDRYTVAGHVDSENSFGASLRSEWTCQATWVSGTDWRPVTAHVSG
jgi:hypothetical protein